MNLALQGLLFFGLTLALSLAMTRLMITLAPRLGLMDTPGERRIHTKVIPRAGGLAVWISLIISLFILTRASDLTGKLDNHWLWGFGYASLALVITGVIDDRWGMNAWLKLFMHALSAVILFYTKGETDGAILGIQVPQYVELAIWIVWTVAIINAFNLIDGMDGLCAGLGLISVGSLMVLNIALGSASDAIVLVCMMGALLGFLRYNFHPARIFLGDTGSMLIGFFIASVALVSTGERFTVASLLLPIIVAGVPIIDVMLAVWRRSFRSWLAKLGVGKKGSVFGADQHHLHHRLLSYGLTQRKVAGILYGLAILASVIALVPSLFDHRTIGLTIAALFVSALIGFRYLAPVELKISGEVLNLMIQKPRRGKLSRFLLTAYDTLAILCGIVVAFFLTTDGKIPSLNLGDYAKTTIIPTSAITLAFCLLFLNAGKAYSRRWSRASLRDFLALGIWFCIGVVVATTINVLISGAIIKTTEEIIISGMWFDTMLTQIIAASVTGLLLVIPRIITPFIRESVIDTQHRNLSRSSGQRPRVLLYGAGDMGELFLNHVKITADRHFEQMRIVGFLDDHAELGSRFIHGFRIHGDLSALEDLCKKWDLHGIILTTRVLSNERVSAIKDACNELELSLYEWNPSLDINLIEPSQKVNDIH